jgi:N-methylhydantoinase A
LHGGALTRLIGCPVQLMPPAPGVLSALGLLASSLRAEFSRSSVQRKGRFDLGQIAEVFAGLERDALEWLQEEGVADSARRMSWHASLRYEEQGSELALPWPGRAADQAALGTVLKAFHAEHERLYSFRLDEVPVELVTLRVDALGLLLALKLSEIPARGPAAKAIVGKHRISLASGAVEAPVYDRMRLGAGARLEGPAIVKQLDATTLLLPGQMAEVNKFGSLIVREH